MNRRLTLIFHIALLSMLALILALPSFAAPSAAGAKVKDIADLEGVRTNMLIGYGLIVGLNGTGDSIRRIPFTRQSLVNMLERLGVNSKDAASQLRTKNVAAVMVTGSMDSFARQGSKMDVTVSSLGDASSLEGGLLLATPLMGADGETYAVGQGALVIGGFTAEGRSGTITKNHPTVGRIADGATVERETGFELAQLGGSLKLMLRDPDFTTAMRVRDAINKAFGGNISQARDHHTIDVTIPANYQQNMVGLIEKMENLRVVPATSAKVVVDEKTGTIVMGQDVRISDVAISHSNLVIQVYEEQAVSQPLAFSETGETITTDNTDIIVNEVDDPELAKFKVFGGGPNLSDLVNGLNALGVQPRDIISILQNIKAAGALQAELVVL